MNSSYDLVVNKQKIQVKECKPRHVTFYGDRVEVTRILVVDLLEGDNEIFVSGFSEGFLPSSTRIKTVEKDGNLISVLEVAYGHQPTPTPFDRSHIADFEEQIRKLQDENENIELELQGISDEEKFLEEYAESIKRPRGSIEQSLSINDVLDKLVDETYLEKVQNFMKFYRGEKKKFTKEKKTFHDKLLANEESIFLLQQHIETAENSFTLNEAGITLKIRAQSIKKKKNRDLDNSITPQKESITLWTETSTHSKGSLRKKKVFLKTFVSELIISYFILGPCWNALYHARFDLHSSSLQLIYYASILNTSGEDFMAADVSLTRQDPAHLEKPPDLLEKLVDFRENSVPTSSSEFGLTNLSSLSSSFFDSDSPSQLKGTSSGELLMNESLLQLTSSKRVPSVPKPRPRTHVRMTGNISLGNENIISFTTPHLPHVCTSFSSAMSPPIKILPVSPSSHDRSKNKLLSSSSPRSSSGNIRSNYFSNNNSHSLSPMSLNSTTSTTTTSAISMTSSSSSFSLRSSDPHLSNNSMSSNVLLSDTYEYSQSGKSSPRSFTSATGSTEDTFFNRSIGTFNIPSDIEKPTNLVIDDLNLPVELCYRIVANVLKAYLKASVKNTTNLPFLAGKAHVFVNGNFLHTKAFEFTNINESFFIHLGTDLSIKVESQEIKNERTRSNFGCFSTKQKHIVHTKLTVTNTKLIDVNLTLYNQLPRPTNSDIKVILKAPEIGHNVKLTAENHVERKAKVKAGESEHFDFHYVVEFPLNKDLDFSSSKLKNEVDIL